MTPAREQRQERDFQFGMLMVSLLGAFALFMLGTYTLFSRAPGLVRMQDDTVGEMLLDEGLRRLEGGAPEEARTHFALARNARFEGLKNRRHLELQLGDQALADGSQLEAEDHYAAAAEDYALAEIDPALLLRAFAGHAECLVRAGAWTELDAFVDSRPSGVPVAAAQESIEAAQRYYRALAAQAEGREPVDFPEDWSAAAWAEARATTDPARARALARLGLTAPLEAVRERSRSLLISLPQ
ncbi:MAG: hypothetical protein GC168_13935 [Candidatus Hydrogenedens sp.]|nr:hypothetical protein [Candidatus Hydrogenedens sp.]